MNPGFLLKCSRQFFSLLAHRALGRYVPLYVTFHISDKCNLRCAYCFGLYYDRKLREPSFDDIKTVLLKLKKSGTKKVNFSGGEPLLRTDIGKIVSFAKGLGFLVSMTTNGTLFKEKAAQGGHWLKDLDFITFSFDGISEQASRSRGVDGRLVLEAIRQAHTYVKEIHAAFVIHKNNIDSIEDVIKLAKQNSFKIYFNPLMINQSVFKPGHPVYALAVTPDEYRRAITVILAMKKKGYPVFFSKPAYEYVLRWPDFSKMMLSKVEAENLKLNNVLACRAGKYSAVIDTDLRAYPCEMLTYGNYKGVDMLDPAVGNIAELLCTHDCAACLMPCYVEANLIFSLHPGCIFYYVTGKDL